MNKGLLGPAALARAFSLSANIAEAFGFSDFW
jgi:hypothetical protein